MNEKGCGFHFPLRHPAAENMREEIAAGKSFVLRNFFILGMKIFIPAIIHYFLCEEEYLCQQLKIALSSDQS